ncbi:hypothetical protein ACFC8N_46335 [Streptomyces sp. NPDC055966]
MMGTDGDFNGDDKDYAVDTPAVFTLTADSNGGFAAPVRRYTDQ